MRVQSAHRILGILTLSFCLQFVLVVSVAPSDEKEQSCKGPALDHGRVQSVKSVATFAAVQEEKTYQVRESFPVKLSRETGPAARSSCALRIRLKETREDVPIFGAELVATLPSPCDPQNIHSLTDSLAKQKTGWRALSFSDISGKTFSKIHVKEGYRPLVSRESVVDFLQEKYHLDPLSPIQPPELVVFPTVGKDYLAYAVKLLVPKNEYNQDTRLLHLFVDAHQLNVISSCVISSSPQVRQRSRNLPQEQNGATRRLAAGPDDNLCQSCAFYQELSSVASETFLQNITSLYLNDTGKRTPVQNATVASDGSIVQVPAQVDNIHWLGTYDCEQGWSTGDNCSLVALPPCPDAISDVQYAAVETLKYTKSQLKVLGGLSMSPTDPQPVRAAVHYGQSECNAYYSYNEVIFGDCDCLMWSPLVAIDVVAHELAHGMTEYSSGLYYYGQSGGLNEAYSDILGTIIEFYINDRIDRPDFFIGETLQGSYGILRYMEDPPKDGISIGSVCDYYDGIDVHFSSGVLNKAFVKSVRACQNNNCARTEKECTFIMGKLFFYTNLSQLTSLSTFLDTAEKTCSVVDEYFAQLAPVTSCTIDQVRAFAIQGWREVDVIINEMDCTAQPIEDCPTRSPTSAPSAPPQIDFSEGCLNATLLPLPSTTFDTTIGAPNYDLEPCLLEVVPSSHGFGSSPGLWYQIVGNGGIVAASMCDLVDPFEPGDPMISVWTGDCYSLQCVAINDDYCGLWSWLTFDTTLGQIYYIFVHGFSGSTYNFGLSLISSTTSPTWSPTAPPIDPEVGCSQAIVLGLPSTTVDTTEGADTYIVTACGDAASSNSPGLWYTVVGTGDEIIASICGDGTSRDLIMSVWTGPCDNLQCIGGSDVYGCSYQSGISWISVPEQIYYIYVYGFSGFSGPFELTLTSQRGTPAPTWAPTVAPLDPEVGCSGALAKEVPSETFDTTAGAEIYASDSCGYAQAFTSAGLWYNVTGTGSYLTASLCGSYFDTVMSVWTGPCGDLQCIEGSDDSCGAGSFVGWDSVFGQVYYVFVYGFGGATGDFLLTLQSEATWEPTDTRAPTVTWAPSTPTKGPSTGTASPSTGTPSPSTGTPSPSEVTPSPSTGTPSPSTGTRSPSTTTPSPSNGTPSPSTGTLSPSEGALDPEVGCSAAIAKDVPSETFGSTVGSEIYASDSCGNAGAFASAGSWYRVVGTGSFLTAYLCDSNFDTVVSVWTGPCGDLQCVEGDDDGCGGGGGSFVGWDSVRGQVYYVFVYGYMGYTGDFHLTLQSEGSLPQGPPSKAPMPTSTPTKSPNVPILVSMEEGCSRAVEVTLGSSVSGSTIGESRYLSMSCGAVSSLLTPGSWFKLIGATGGPVTASLCSTDSFDTMVSVWTGDCSRLVCVGGNDDSECGAQSSVTFSSRPGQNYYLFVHGSGGESGPFELEITTGSEEASKFRSGPGDLEADSTMKTLQIQSQLTFTFFEGKGSQPAEKDVEVLIGETSAFFKQQFKASSSFSSAFLGLQIVEIMPHYDASPEGSDKFVLVFVTEIKLASRSQLQASDAADIMAKADYKEYIGQYARKVRTGPFANTHVVRFKGVSHEN